MPPGGKFFVFRIIDAKIILIYVTLRVIDKNIKSPIMKCLKLHLSNEIDSNVHLKQFYLRKDYDLFLHQKKFLIL